jgi:tetratricopeptide (TPR) repeat protein
MTTTRARTLPLSLALVALALAGCRKEPTTNPGMCEDFELDVERVWSTAQRKSVRAGMEALIGSTTVNVERVVTKMDTITRDWVMMSRRACKDTVERKTMPAEVYTRVTLCLDAALVQQRTLITRLEHVDMTSYEHIDAAMLDISEQITSCQNEALVAYYRKPEETADAGAAQTADTKTAEARTLIALGQVDEATALLDEATAAAEQSGDDRRKVEALVTACEHALVLGEFDHALGHGRPALATAQKAGYALGESDALACLGTAELRSGRFSESRTHLDTSLKIREGIFGPDHPRVADSLNRLGNLDELLADYAKAQALYKRAHDIWTATFGPTDPITTRVQHNLGAVHVGIDDLPGAVAWYTQAINSERESLGPEHPATALSEANLAGVKLRLGETEDALDMLQHAMAVQEKLLGANHPETAATYLRIGDAWAAKKSWDSALEWYQKSLTSRQAALGEQHLDTAESYDAIGRALTKKKKWDEAKAALDKGLEIRVALVGPDTLIAAQSYFNLGVHHQARKQWKDALGWFEKSLVIEERVRGVSHRLTLETKATVDQLRDLVGG